MNQDGVVSPLSLTVQAPVNICTTKDSLHKVCDGVGKPCWSCHIVAIDRAAIKASNIHIVRLIILVSVALVATSLLYVWEDHFHQHFFRLQRGRLRNDRPDVCYQDCLSTAGANWEGLYFRLLTCRRRFLASIS